MRGLMVCVALIGVARAAVPDDARLGAARAELQAVFEAAARDGVPEALLADKVREGLAKNVPAPRIAGVVRGLEQTLATARIEAQAHVGAPPPALLKAIAEAHAASATRSDVERVLAAAAPRGAEPATRAVEVLTDLSQRGYPPSAAAQAIAEVTTKNPGAVTRLPSQAETLRLRAGATRTDVLDALARASEQGLGLERAAEVLGRAPGPPDDRGPNRESTGGHSKDRGRGKP
jgi:hypothetical protein